MGYPLHGQDITLDVTPNQARLGWAVGWKKDAFWGRDVLLAEKEAGPKRLLRGLVADRPRHPAPGDDASSSRRTSRSARSPPARSRPTLRKGVGLALVPTFVDPEAEVSVDVRGRRELFRSTKPPFVDPSVRES